MPTLVGGSGVVPITPGRNQWKAVDWMSYTVPGHWSFDFTSRTAAGLADKSLKLGGGVYVWFRLNGSGTDPHSDTTGISLDIVSSDTPTSIAAAFASALPANYGDDLLISYGPICLFIGKNSSLALTDVNSGVGLGSHPGGGTVAPSNFVAVAHGNFYSFDVNSLSNRAVQRYSDDGGVWGGGANAAFSSSNYHFLAVCNRILKASTDSRIYFRRGQFTPSGSRYFKQIWKSPLASSDLPTWSSGSTYAAGTMVHKPSNGIFVSKQNGNLNHTPPASGSDSWWKRASEKKPAGAAWTVASWDIYHRFQRWNQPTIVRVPCTPDVPVTFNLSDIPAGEVWLIADELTDFPVEYPYEVSSSNEIALRALLAGSVSRASLKGMRDELVTINSAIASISRIGGAIEVNAVARILSRSRAGLATSFNIDD